MLKWLALAAIAAVGFGLQTPSSQSSKPFGGTEDVAFARDTWKAMKGYENWKLTTKIYKGASPHGKWVRLYSTFIKVRGKSYAIIVKDNYGGRGATPERIAKDPHKWLKAITVMIRREAGYDAPNQDWFWAKFSPDGEIDKNSKGMRLAGRVAKGMSRGCISCHSQAGDDDYLFSNDR